MMELRHIRAFLMVAEELHFARAAERLGIAPPSLTVQIRLLEDHLGVPLFRRTKRRVELTRAGETLLPEARATLVHAARLTRQAEDARRGEAGRVMLGYVGSAVYSGVLQQEVARFRAVLPNVELQIREAVMRDMPAMVEDGTLDIGFVRWPVPLPSTLKSRVVLEDDFLLLLPEAHSLATYEGPVLPAALADDGFILPEQEAGTLEVARRGGFTPHVVAVPGHLAAVATMVSLGMGVAVVPASLSRLAMPAVCFKALEGPPIHSAIAAIFRQHEPAAVVTRFIRSLNATRESP